VKKITFLLAWLFCSCTVFSNEAKGPVAASDAAYDPAIGFFITDNGYAVTRYQLIGDASEITATIEGKPVSFELVSGDVVNDIAVIKPKTEIKVKPVSLLMGESEPGQKVVCLAYEKAKDQTKPILLKGSIESSTGINGEIHHLKLKFDAGVQPRQGEIFNLSGIGLGMVSNRMTDVYSLVHDEKETNTLCLATKMDSLFPLIKGIPGVLWSKPEEKPLTDEDWKKIQTESIFLLQVKGKMPLKAGLSESFSQILTQVPPNTLFIMITSSSGYSNVSFADKLLEQLKKEKIGSTLSPTIKQQYYSEIYKRFGHPDITPDQLVKMAAGLSEGYYLEASCNVVSGEVEDHVQLNLYKPNLADPVITVRQSKVIASDPAKILDQLTELAVKELGKQIKAKKINLSPMKK
jgi:hypothetical protein